MLPSQYNGLLLTFLKEIED